MSNEDVIERVRKKYNRLTGVLDERGRRVWAAVEADSLGYGGQSIVAKATGLSRTTLHRGGLEIAQDQSANRRVRIRAKGGGRRKLTEQEPKLLTALEALVEPTTRGDPESMLRWTCRSTRQLASALNAQGYRIGHQTVAHLLDDLGYSLQGNRKTIEGSSHPDRAHSSSIFKAGLKNFCNVDTPSCRWTRRKKKMSATLKIMEKSGS